MTIFHMLKFLTDVRLSALLKTIQEAFSTFGGQTRDYCIPAVMTKPMLYCAQSLYSAFTGKSYYIMFL